MPDRARQPADKFRRYRAAKRAAGLREVRLWVPDLRNPAVLAELSRQGRNLRDSSEQHEATSYLSEHLRDADD
jgi:hypothetical protein